METAKRARTGVVVVGLVVVGLVALWGYVVYLAVGPGRQDPPDRLDDPAFAEAAEARCHRTLVDVARLPLASETRSPTARAEVIDEANSHFGRMLDDLGDIAPEGADGELVREWLADWRTYLGDRARYADALRDDPDAQLFVSVKQGDHVTEYLDAFAADNRMPSCATPLDV